MNNKLHVVSSKEVDDNDLVLPRFFIKLVGELFTERDCSVNSEEFLRCLELSMSLDYVEKLQVIEHLLKDLTDFQVTELMKVFEEEQAKFYELAVEHPDEIAHLTMKRRGAWE